MKFVLFGGFLMLSSAVLIAGFMNRSGSSDPGVLFAFMGFGFVSAIYGLIKKE